MVLVGAAVLPHGTMIFDGDPHSESAACRKRNSTMPTGFIKQCSALYSSCERAADLLAKMNPDVVILVTPHGLSLSSGSLGIYLASVAQGNALWNDEWREVELNVPLDSQLAAQLLEFVQQRGIKADGVITFSMMEAPIRWAEVVPLWFINSKTDSDKVKYVIVATARNTEGLDVIGKAFHEFVSGLEQRVALVMSGDLAHTHETTCNIPLYLPGIYILIISS